MPTRNFDVVILGGGNAGMGVTVATREAGLSVAMIEPDLLGGTCPNRGCMPKKVLVAAAHALEEIERAKAHHIYQEGGVEHAIEADRVVNGAGRIADVDGLDLSIGNIASARGQIALDA